MLSSIRWLGLSIAALLPALVLSAALPLEETSVEIAPSRYLLAVLVTGAEQVPIAGAEVALDGVAVGLTDVDGRYYMARKPFAKRAHEMRVKAPGYATFTAPITLPEGDAPGIRIPVRLVKKPVAARPPVRGGRKPNYHTMRIFYVTDRRDTGSADPLQRFANERAADGALSKGMCDVSIPRTHESGQTESPSWIHLEFRPDPDKHITLLKVNPLAGDAFYQQLSQRVAKSRQKSIFVFIHGFANSFEMAARTTAQLTWDLKFDGAPILYSWPSRARILGYTQDEDTIQWTAFHLRAFLEELAQRSDAKKIHLIAHSMGNRALTSALQIIAAKRQNAPQPLFDQVVLAAPDIGSETMELLAREVRPVARRMTLYASNDDDALLLSKVIHGGLRAGGIGERLLLAPGIDTVDASAARTDFLGHAYFGNSVDIIPDIQKILFTAASPQDRALIPALVRDLPYWIIPPAAVHP